MIIFQAVPSRLFRVVIDNLLPQIGINYQDFHYPFMVTDYHNWLDDNNILKAIPAGCKHERLEKHFLFGVFPSENLNLRDGDFLFTLLNHPVDHIYECFAYMDFTVNRSGPRSEEGLRKFNCDRYEAEIEVAKSIDFSTLEQFIDMVLEDSDFDFNYLNIKYRPFKEIIYGFEDVSRFNYINKYENLTQAYEKLSDIFKVKLVAPKDTKTLSYYGHLYKKELLEEKFKKQIEFYNNLI
jgi:hypothetical protein